MTGHWATESGCLPRRPADNHEAARESSRGLDVTIAGDYGTGKRPEQSLAKLLCVADVGSEAERFHWQAQGLLYAINGRSNVVVGCGNGRGGEPRLTLAGVGIQGSATCAKHDVRLSTTGVPGRWLSRGGWGRRVCGRYHGPRWRTRSQTLLVVDVASGDVLAIMKCRCCRAKASGQMERGGSRRSRRSDLNFRRARDSPPAGMSNQRAAGVCLMARRHREGAAMKTALAGWTRASGVRELEEG
jgi:hypothetical protein